MGQFPWQQPCTDKDFKEPSKEKSSKKDKEDTEATKPRYIPGLFKQGK